MAKKEIPGLLIEGLGMAKTEPMHDEATEGPEILESYASSPAPGEFFSTLLHSATIAHQIHFKTRSFAIHKALGKFYEEVVELTDGLVESWQGKYGLVKNFPFKYDLETEDPESFLADLDYYVKTHRELVSDDSEIQNDIDTIQTLINSTTYKIRFLK
jgi:hypothetical protein